MIDEAQIITPAGLATEAGPWTGMEACRGDEPVSVKLRRPLGDRGAVMAWVRLDEPILNGPGVETDGGTVLELPGLAKLNLWWYRGYGGIVWEMQNGPNVPVEVPGLPGPQWFHLCYTWDAVEGRAQGYVDGTPIRMPGLRAEAWSNDTAGEIRMDTSRWALAEVVAVDRWVGREEVLAAVPSIYRGGLDHTLGAQELGELDPAPWRGEKLFEIPLDAPEQIANWRMEGPGEVTFHDGWMRMRSTTPDAPGKEGHIVHWPDVDLPADFLLEFDVRVLSDNGLNIVFFCAKGRDGRDALDPTLSERTGIFGHYTQGDINCYHVSYFAGGGRTTSNLRKNHGFYLVDNGPIGIRSGSREIHHVALLKCGGTIRLGIDGRRVIDWHDDGRHYGPVLGDGKVALRQMKPTTAEYRDLTGWALPPSASAT
ncbi:MAG: DUF1961 family protein [Planctomycetota bacterium]